MTAKKPERGSRITGKARPKMDTGAKERPPKDPLVLVVDDYADGRELVVDVLTAAGIRTAEAADGESALERATELMPDVVLMDVSMPGMDGWEITKRLKAQAKTAEIPVLMLTAHALPEHAIKAREVGSQGFITKPVLPVDLLAAVRAALDAPSKKKS
jgi:CheY-like chemotaxis protein